jgi:hypothetical protein
VSATDSVYKAISVLQSEPTTLRIKAFTADAAAASVPFSPETAFASWALALKFGLRGDQRRALEAITPAFAAAGTGTERLARELGHCYALAGEKALALSSLERAVAIGLGNDRFRSESDRFLDPLRDEPRFQDILRRVKAERETLAAAAVAS